MHPDRVGLPAAPYATNGLPMPWETLPPVETGEVPAWVRAPPEARADVIRQATEILLASDPDTDVTRVLRAAQPDRARRSRCCAPGRRGSGPRRCPRTGRARTSQRRTTSS
ncbi:hypothetical protein SGPA1_21970 [Streptomyces misionensis JCM 4497]